TLSVDVARSDLLLETELQRFAEPVAVSHSAGRLEASANGRRLYRLTPTTLAAARTGGLNLSLLDAWLEDGCGQPLSPAARLLLRDPDPSALRFERHLVLHVAEVGVAEGLWQWPATRALIQQRLGPTALSVAETDMPQFLEQLRRL